MASRLGVNSFFCIKEVFGAQGGGGGGGHFQCLTGSKEKSGMLITCGPYPWV